MKIYFISGLAADKRVFKNIHLPEGYKPIYLDWITPHKKETLTDYALRLGASIPSEEPFGLVGLSMGGMMAATLARHLHPDITILISSAPCYTQLPDFLKVAGRLHLHKLVPIAILKQGTIIKRLFSHDTAEDKKILCQVVRESDTAFIRWAMDAVLNWKEKDIPGSYIHIHGTKDDVLPIRFTQPTHIIKGGGHLMVMNRADELNAIIEEQLISIAQRT